jgi:hypothetical protein
MQRDKKRKRRLGRTLLTVYVVVAATIFFCGCNLYHYAFYYATHMPHNKNEYPVVREIVRHRLPNSVNKKYHSNINANEGTRDEFVSGGLSARNVFKKGDVWTLDMHGASYYPNDIGGSMIFFDFETKYRIGKFYADSDINPKTESFKVTDPLKDLTYQLKDESLKPIINLQWLYNLWYQNK